MTFSDGTSGQIQCDITGHGSINIAKGRVYSASVANKTGYFTPGPYKNIKASLSQRTLQFIYTRQWEGTSVIEVELSVSNGGELNDFVGKNLGIFEDNSENIYTSSNGIVENEKVIYTFPGVTSGKAYTIPVFHDQNSNIFTVNDRRYTNDSVSGKTLNIVPNTNYETLRISYRLINQNYGIFLVNGITWEETEITQDFIDTLTTDMKSTYPYIHVCTENLTNVGCDYYVRCRDLTGERLSTESTWKQWATSNITLPHVSYNTTNEYNGRKQTYYMAYDSRNSGISSPSAEFANSQVIEINGLQVNGFIGTRGQMDIIYGNSTNRTAVINTLTKLGYSSINFNSTITWSSSQAGSSHSYDWHGGSWGNDYKVNSILVVPFFSIP